MAPQRPAVLTGTLEGWPALERWPDIAYLLRVCGHRTVPIELGEHYLADGWGTQLMTLSEFIPALRADIRVPEYCVLGEGEVQATNAWFGPAGTVTPLHTDPHHNLLCQVVGAKYVRLYAPGCGPTLRPHTSGLTTNTSTLDLDAHAGECEDYPGFPGLTEARFQDCVLQPGQALFIPPGWWHYVRSLSASFSVSFWWR
ncbi:hypothetical protein FOA52_004861 [Chlamydomonas sp. UWO 241]|nr:hypothetical protein FOA52_004861 [Chlamydomonas sp. UWO 241]